MSPSKRRKTSIMNKLLSIIIPVVSLLVIILIAISFQLSKQMMQNASQELLRSSVSSQASKINAWLDQNLNSIAAVKQGIESSDLDTAAMQKLVNGYYNYNSNFPEGIYIASSDGSTIKASESNKSFDNYMQSTWYKHGLTNVSLSVTDPYKNDDGELIISASGMIKSDSKNISVLSADMGLDSVTIIVNASISMEDASAFLVDTNNMTILAHRDSSLLGTNITSSSDRFMSEVAKRIAARDYSQADINGNLTAFKEVGSTGWLLVSYIPNKLIYADVTRLGIMMIAIGALAIVILAFIIVFVIRYVVKPIAGLTGNITQMSSGDFTIEIDHRGNDEIATMGESLEDFSGSMRNMISDIRDTADMLENQAENSKAAANEMYESAKIQGESMEQLKETVNQLSESVNDIANNATTLAGVVADTRDSGESAGKMMKKTVEVSEKAKTEMQEVGEAMNHILENMQSLQTAIGEVGTASEEITNIVTLIGEIADETNLLSLNASIEAARAGEAGRGFAVVATEISKLASNSADSVDKISNLTNQIRQLINNAVNQANESAANVNESSSSIKGAVDTFDEIYRNIEETNGLISRVLEQIEEVDGVATNVAAISEEQAASSEEILATSESMVEQANHITTNSQMVADDSEQLAESSVRLAEHVSKFKISKDDSKEVEA